MTCGPGARPRGIKRADSRLLLICVRYRHGACAYIRRRRRNVSIALALPRQFNHRNLLQLCVITPKRLKEIEHVAGQHFCCSNRLGCGVRRNLVPAGVTDGECRSESSEARSGWPYCVYKAVGGYNGQAYRNMVCESLDRKPSKQRRGHAWRLGISHKERPC